MLLKMVDPDRRSIKVMLARVSKQIGALEDSRVSFR